MMTREALPEPPARRLQRHLRQELSHRGLLARLGIWYRDQVPESLRAFLRGLIGHRPGSGAPCDAGAEWRQGRLRRFLADHHARLSFPAPADPLVSIIILNYNRAAELLECLQSVRDYSHEVPFELIVADNASTDLGPEVLRRLDNVLVLSNRDNLGFVRGNNRAVRHARGRYLLFLNNDTVVTPGWLSALVRTVEGYPGCGVVGPRFLYPDGRLQEAGGICWAEGRVMQYGIGGDALAPDYQHVREVDYVSGACLLVRADLFRERGGFDDRYAPAYYEDVDLCFGIRSVGQRVVYQPAAVVFHHGASAEPGALCRANRVKFVRKWAAELEGRIVPRMPGDLVAARDLRGGLRVLVVDGADSRVPGELTAIGCVVTYLPPGELPAGRAERLRQAGIEVLPGAEGGLEGWLERRCGCFEAVLILSLPGCDCPVQEAGRLLPATMLHRNPGGFVLDRGSLFHHDHQGPTRGQALPVPVLTGLVDLR